MYRSIFIDLDNTVWDFSQNSTDTFREIYEKYHFERYFDSFEQFFALYKKKNEELWMKYGNGQITKDNLNAIRYAYPFRQVDAYDEKLIHAYTEDYMRHIALKKKLMPHVREALEYLHANYDLYILSNGFRELQTQKLRFSGVERYFKKVILSEDIGVHKPNPIIYNFALSSTQSILSTSIMIGDSWTTDMAGAQHAGMDHIYYNTQGDSIVRRPRPTYEIKEWLEIMRIL